MEFAELLRKQLHSLKGQIIELSHLVNNSEITKWAQLWQNDDELEPSIIVPEIVILDSEIKTAWAHYKLAVMLFRDAIKCLISGELEESLKMACQTKFYLGFFCGAKLQIDEFMKQKGKIRHEKTREIKRIVIEYYIEKNLQNRADTNAAHVILDSRVIENSPKKWEAPTHKTLVAYISFIKQLLAICQKLTPWEDVKNINIDSAKRVLTKEEFSRYTICYSNGDIQNYFQCIKINLVLFFLDSNLENAAAKKASLEKAKMNLVALGEMYIREWQREKPKST